MLLNSFLSKSHYTILIFTLNIKVLFEDKEPLHILSFVSLQINQSIAKGIIL